MRNYLALNIKRLDLFNSNIFTYQHGISSSNNKMKKIKGVILITKVLF